VNDPIADFKLQPHPLPAISPTGTRICVCCGTVANTTARWGGLRFDLCEGCQGTTLVARLTGENHQVELKSGYKFKARERTLVVICPAHGERDHDAPFQEQTRFF